MLPGQWTRARHSEHYWWRPQSWPGKHPRAREGNLASLGQPYPVSAADHFPGCASQSSFFQIRVFTLVQWGRLWGGLNELPDNTWFFLPRKTWGWGRTHPSSCLHTIRSRATPRTSYGAWEWRGNRVERWSWYMNPKSILSAMPTLWSFFHLQFCPLLPTPPNDTSEPKASLRLLVDCLSTRVSNECQLQV